MISKVKNFEIGIDSSLSYCSITLFKNEKIIWDKTVKSEYGHEIILSELLQNLVTKTKIKADHIKKLHLNYGTSTLHSNKKLSLTYERIFYRS